MREGCFPLEPASRSAREREQWRDSPACSLCSASFALCARPPTPPLPALLPAPPTLSFSMRPLDERLRPRRAGGTRSALLLAGGAIGLCLPLLLYTQYMWASRRRGGENSVAQMSNTATALAELARRNTRLVSQLLPPNGSGVLSASPATASPSEVTAGDARAPTDALAGSHRPWLRIAIISVGRTSGAEYLLHTLRALLHCRPTRMRHPLRSAMEIVVVNNHEPAGDHAVLQRARMIFAGRIRFIAKSQGEPSPACKRHEGRKVGKRQVGEGHAKTSSSLGTVLLPQTPHRRLAGLLLAPFVRLFLRHAVTKNELTGASSGRGRSPPRCSVKLVTSCSAYVR